MISEYRSRVLQLAADVLGEPVEQISDESSPESIESWDSLQHLNLILSVEDAFDLQLSPEEIEEVKTIGALVTLVASKSGPGP